MAREALSLTEFVESERSRFAVAVGAPGMELSEPLSRLASAVETPFIDGRLLSALPPKAAVTLALCRILSLPAPTDFAAALSAAEAHCLSGRDLWLVGDGFTPGPALRALLAALQAVRSSLASHPAAGRVMVALRVTAFPRHPDLLLAFERWLQLPEPAPEPPGSLPVPFAPAAVARARYWAEGCCELAVELFRLGSSLAHRRRAAAVSSGHIDEAAEVLLARHTWLIHAGRAAQDLPAALLDLLLRCDVGQPFCATGNLRPATLDRLVVDGVLRCAGPRRWRWSSHLHYTAVERARSSVRGETFVRFFVRDRAETRTYSGLQGLLRSGGAELTVDAVRKTVRVGSKTCHAISGALRCFRLLDCLLSRALDGSEVVTYDEIIETVYPDILGADRTNIHPAIAKLRRVIGADIWSRLVMNLPGVGYRILPAAVGLIYVRPLGSMELDSDGTANDDP